MHLVCVHIESDPYSVNIITNKLGHEKGKEVDVNLKYTCLDYVMSGLALPTLVRFRYTL